MRGQLRYDGDLQMFVAAPRDPSLIRLRFLRWLAEHGRLEHAVAGPPHGALAVVAVATRPCPTTARACTVPRR